MKYSKMTRTQLQAAFEAKMRDDSKLGGRQTGTFEVLYHNKPLFFHTPGLGETYHFSSTQDAVADNDDPTFTLDPTDPLYDGMLIQLLKAPQIILG